MKRRGQVTAYILIALVILISLGILIFFRSEIIGDDGLTSAVENVPFEVKPVQKFVEFNLESALVLALKNLGQHSGYVDPYSFAPIENADEPTEAAALKPFATSSRILPYWYFMQSGNQCDSMCNFRTLKPRLTSDFKKGSERPNNETSIEAQIDRYLESKMLELDFSDFRLQNLDVKRVTLPQVTTRITDNSVIVELVMPLEVTKDSTKHKMERFNAKTDIGLKRVYQFADTLTSQERSTHFIENYVTELLSVYSGMGTGRLPPVGRAVEFATSPVFWKMDNVRTQISREILSKVSAIPVKGTLNFASKTGLTKSVVDLKTDIFSDMEVYFSFPDNRPYYLSINGLTRGMLGPSTITNQILFYTLIINKYAFAYDLSFPVMVTLKLPNGLNGEDYVFQFALEANIRGNRPLFEGATGASEESENTMLCEEEQALSGEIAIKAQASDGVAVDNVDVYYHCAGQGCYIGKTDRSGVLKSKLPICIGGLIVPIKERYIGDPVEFDTQLGRQGAAPTMMLDKTSTFKLDIKKVVFEPSAVTKLSGEQYKWPHEFGSFRGLGYPTKVANLEPDEGVFLLFKRVAKGGLSTYQFPVYARGNGSVAEALLASGEYEIDMMLFKDKQLIIPEKNCSTIGQIVGCVPSQRIVMNNSVQAGGGKVKGVKLSSNSMGSKTLTIYSVYLDIYSIPEADRKAMDLTVLSKLDDYSAYLSKYPPVFS